MNNFNLLNATTTTDASGNMIMWIVIYAALFAALYFFLIRPNNKKKKAEAEMRNSIEVGDEVTTIGGIMGRVVAVKDDEDAIIIETGSDRNKLKMKKWCISVNETQQEKANAAQPTKKKGLFGSKKKTDEE
jgi:preprotein translocase subunit YajC